MTKEGTVLDGKYEILAEVGRGGMSIVYLARDKRLNKQWAVKEIKNDGKKSAKTLLKGLEREANILKNVDHPVLPRIVDIINQDGTIYVVMDYIEGDTIQDRLKKEGAQPQELVVEWGLQLASALNYLHNMNPPVIYRDMKPSNVMIKPEGGVKLIDFGTAKEYEIENNADTTALGTRGYAAPEQFGDSNGRGIYNTDARTDIYNLGATLYHIVTGKNPCEPPYEIKPIREWNPMLSSGLEKIILKCTQKNPDRRYASMTALLADLRKALISPNEDFVVMVPLANQDKTRVIGADDLNQIKKQTANVYIDPASIKIQEPVIDDDDEDDDDDIDDEDGDINPKMEKAITIMGIAAGVVIIIIIIYLCITLAGGMKSNKNNSSNTETTKTETQTGDSQSTQIKDGVVVPSLTGKTMDQAKQELNGTGLGIRQAGTASSDTVEKGQIISQDPADGKTVEKNTTIEVIISSGSAAGTSENTVEIPNVVGQSETDASAALTAKGFQVTKTTSYSSSVAEGYVISQTPNGDTKGKEGDTITLEISLGSEKITVPDVSTSYKSEEQAKELLSQFNVSTVTKYSDTDAGIVIGQSLASGTQADPGASITITVSLGPEPAQQITTKTYKLNVSLQLPSDTSNISGADIVLYDDQGNVLQTWYGKTIADFGTGGLILTKTGILSDSGKIVVTWLDLNGNDLKDQTIDVQFQEE